MKILAIEHEIPGHDGAAPATLRDEALPVWQLQQADTVREVYFRSDRLEAVLVLEAKDVAEAERTLATLPLIQQRKIRFELIPLRPYPGFGRLFANPTWSERPAGFE